MNRYGNPKQENGKITRILSNTWCHQCKMKHQKIVVCDHFWDENRNSKCNGRYCTNCCKRHYGEDLSSLENLDNWTCYKCANKCVCAACRRLRGANNNQENNHSNPLIQKGKRKRNKVKLIEDEEDEEDEEEVLEDEEEEEFYPSVKFEKNLRSRKKNEKNSNSNNVSLQNNTINKKSSPPRNSSNTEPKKPIPKNNNQSSSPTHSSKNKNVTTKPTENKKQKVQSPQISISSNNNISPSPSQNPKIIIPQEDLDNASNSNYMFDILLQVSTLESNEDSNSKQIPNNLVNPFDNIISGNNNQQNLTSFANNLNNKLNNVVDLHQKLIKYESVQSNPLLPSSLHHIFQLRQEVSTLTNELKNMKQDFMKLHRLFESYVQTNEGSHESSPIGYGLSDALHNSQLENLVQNN